MFAKPLFAFALTLFPFTSTFAEDVIFQDQGSFVPGQEAPSFSFPRPDVMGGTPESVEVQLTVALMGQAGIENITKSKVNAVLFTSFGADLTSANGMFQLGTGAGFAMFQTLGAFDGADDYIGESGQILDLREFAAQRTERLAGKALERFLGGIKLQGLQFNVSGGASFSLFGPEYSVLETHTELFIKVQVTYRYGKGQSPAMPSPGKVPGPVPAGQLQANGFINSNRGALRLTTHSLQAVNRKRILP